MVKYESIDDFLQRKFNIGIELVIEEARKTRGRLYEESSTFKKIKEGIKTLSKNRARIFIDEYLQWNKTEDGFEFWYRVNNTLRYEMDNGNFLMVDGKILVSRSKNSLSDLSLNESFIDGYKTVEMHEEFSVKCL